MLSGKPANGAPSSAIATGFTPLRKRAASNSRSASADNVVGPGISFYSIVGMRRSVHADAEDPKVESARIVRRRLAAAIGSQTVDRSFRRREIQRNLAASGDPYRFDL